MDLFLFHCFFGINCPLFSATSFSKTPTNGHNGGRSSARKSALCIRRSQTMQSHVLWLMSAGPKAMDHSQVHINRISISAIYKVEHIYWTEYGFQHKSAAIKELVSILKQMLRFICNAACCTIGYFFPLVCFNEIWCSFFKVFLYQRVDCFVLVFCRTILFNKAGCLKVPESSVILQSSCWKENSPTAVWFYNKWLPLLRATFEHFSQLQKRKWTSERRRCRYMAGVAAFYETEASRRLLVHWMGSLDGNNDHSLQKHMSFKSACNAISSTASARKYLPYGVRVYRRSVVIKRREWLVLATVL